MDPGTILAVVSLILQVAGGVEKVIQSFDRMQNAPQELRDFKKSIRRLERKFADFQKDVQTSSDILHPEDIEEIEETLTLCASLFRKHEDRQGEGVVNAVLRSMWSSSSNERLAKYKARIDEHYSTILVPGWVQLLVRARGVTVQTIQNASLDGVVATKQSFDAYKPASAESEKQLQQISYLVESLKNTQSADSVERTLRQLDEEVHRFRVRIGLPNQDDEVLDSSQPRELADSRRSSTLSAYKDAPTTLYLHNAPQKHQKLKLQRVHILARDDDTRILQYQNCEKTINVTHIVPYGSIPWTPEKDSRRVSFLRAHVITVSDEEGYHNYHIDPKYKFEDLDACRSFQSTLRERDLCEAFDAIEITEASTVIARRQVIRLWQRRRQNELSIATMSFFPSSTGTRKHREIDLADYRAVTKVHTPMFKRQGEFVMVDVVPSVSARRHTKVVRIKFGSAQEAQSFQERWHALHPTSIVPTLVLSPRDTELTGVHSNQSSDHLTHVSIQSGPPSLLYPASSFSVTPRSTPAPTPSDTSWNPAGPPSIQPSWSLDEDSEDWSQWKGFEHGLRNEDGDKSISSA